jgi:membrane protease YdiL (CAAX protease family)
MLEGVPLLSARGLLGMGLLALLMLLMALTVLPDLIGIVLDREPPQQAITPFFVWLNIAAQLLIFFLLPVVYVRLVRPRESALGALGLRVDARTPRNLAIGLGMAVAGTVVVALLLYALRYFGLLTEPESGLVEELGALVREHPEFILAAPLAAGLFEETLFRGFLQPRIGLVASNVVFALVHLAYGTLVQLAVPFVLGLGLGILYRWTRSLWAPVAAHAAFDVIQLLLLYATDSS